MTGPTIIAVFYAKHLTNRLVRVSKKHSHYEIFAGKRCTIVWKGEVARTVHRNHYL